MRSQKSIALAINFSRNISN